MSLVRPGYELSGEFRNRNHLADLKVPSLQMSSPLLDCLRTIAAITLLQDRLRYPAHFGHV